jgi:hypothetical protein
MGKQKGRKGEKVFLRKLFSFELVYSNIDMPRVDSIVPKKKLMRVKLIQNMNNCESYINSNQYSSLNVNIKTQTPNRKFQIKIRKKKE